MRRAGAELDWPALVALQPAAGLIPERLRKHTRRIDAHPGETLFRIGDPVRCVYLVIAGEARLIRRDRKGGEVILQRSRGGFIAEASLDVRAYHCDGIAAEQSTLLLFPAGEFHRALDEEPSFRKAWHAHLASAVRTLRAQCERLCLHGAAERIAHYIEAEGTDGVVTLTQSRKSWAAELGLTHEALYRALRRMQDAQTLVVDGNRLASRR